MINDFLLKKDKNIFPYNDASGKQTRLNVEIDKELYRLMKTYCISHDSSISAVTRALWENLLKENNMYSK